MRHNYCTANSTIHLETLEKNNKKITVILIKNLNSNMSFYFTAYVYKQPHHFYIKTVQTTYALQEQCLAVNHINTVRCLFSRNNESRTMFLQHCTRTIILSCIFRVISNNHFFMIDACPGNIQESTKGIENKLGTYIDVNERKCRRQEP